MSAYEVRGVLTERGKQPMAFPSSVLTVSQLNRFVKSLFDGEKRFKSILLSGEISNFTYHSSGHLYFSLKDQDSVIKGVMFRSYAHNLAFLPENGMRVLVTGDVVVYEKSGVYQVSVYDMQPDGAGVLAIQFERLKQKLEQEGLFDPSHKVPIPSFPHRIAVVTSDTGAAVRDILEITARRDPMAEIVLCPVLVQGKDAPSSIIAALEALAQEKERLDLVILGRGGGSMEDLWAFNNEALAYAIYRFPIPIISAVGHETDFTIADFVADLRAPTPSAAAELATPDLASFLVGLHGIKDQMDRLIAHRVVLERTKLQSLINRPVFKNPKTILQLRRSNFTHKAQSLISNAAALILNKSRQVALASQRLQLLNPLGVLTRGYSILQKDGKSVRSIHQLQVGEQALLQLSDGKADIRILSLKEEKKDGKF